MLRIRDVYPRSRILIFVHPICWIADLGTQIPDPKQQQKRGVKKNCCLPFFVATKITKLKAFINLELMKKKFGPIFKEL
jgi:hypothetical protein